MSASKKDNLQKEISGEKRSGRLAKFLQWLARGNESSPPCQG
jgi:hypothetical protein